MKKSKGIWLHFKNIDDSKTIYNGQGEKKLRDLLDYYGYHIEDTEIIDTENMGSGEIIEDFSYYFYTEDEYFSGLFVNSENFGEIYEKELEAIIPKKIMNKLHENRI